jgi:hypothetical protein
LVAQFERKVLKAAAAKGSAKAPAAEAMLGTATGEQA